MFKHKSSRLSILAILAMSVAFSAQAGSNSNNSDITNNYDQRNYGGNTTNAGGAGGNATGGSAIATGGNSSAVNNVTVNPNIDASTRSNATSTILGSGNSTATGGAGGTSNSASNASGGSVGDVSVRVDGQKYRPTAATAMGYSAPPSAPCMGSSGGGVQGIVGVSFTTTWESDKCNFREDVRAASNFGNPDVAEEMLRGGMPAYAEAEQRLLERKAVNKTNAVFAEVK